MAVSDRTRGGAGAAGLGTPAARSAGVHLDHGRKHYGAGFVVALLHRMARLGLNELQLHVSENEGYRIASARRPEVVSDQHLTPADIARIREAAAGHGIAIVPSLDIPGHAGHLLAAHPELALPDGRGGTVPNALDLDAEATRAFVVDLHDDLAELFPEATTWHIGFDEIIPVGTPERGAELAARARARIAPDADEHDLVTRWANTAIRDLASRGIRARVWNDAFFRARRERLDPRAVITWWTNWHRDMAPLRAAIEEGHEVIDANDSLFYYVLGEAAGYRYPTAERIRDAGWTPGLFPSLPDGIEQRLPDDHPQLAGALFSIWSDRPDAQTPDEVLAGIDAPLAEFAARAGVSPTAPDLRFAR